MTKYKVGDTFTKDGKTHIVISVSKSNPDNFVSHEIRPDPVFPVSQYELIVRICAKLGVPIV